MDPLTLAGLKPETLVFVLLIMAVTTLGTVVAFLYKGREKDKEAFITHLRNESAQLAALGDVVDTRVTPHIKVLKAQLKQIAEKLGVNLIDLG
jgi:hypothetical protein